MSYKVSLDKSPVSFRTSRSETLLESALRSNVLLPYGCRNGACGSCKGRIISGDIEYRDIPLTGITEAEKQSGYALFCQAMARSDLVIAARQVNHPGEIPVRKLPCRVITAEKLNHDVLRLQLKLPDTERLQFVAGQYIDILLEGGKRRSFSLANAPHDDEFLELHIRHYDGGKFSEYAFHSLRQNTLLRIEGPLGTFFLRDESRRPVIMVAGGTGFAPAKSIIEHCIKLSREIPVYLYWGARTRKDLYLHELPERWADKYNWFRYVPVLSEPDGNDHWSGHTGLVHEQVVKDFDDLSAFDVYASGPPPMVEMVKTTFSVQGLPSENLYSDAFEFSAN